MADNEPAEGADGADAIPAKKGKLKLIIAVAGFVLILGGGQVRVGGGPHPEDRDRPF